MDPLVLAAAREEARRYYVPLLAAVLIVVITLVAWELRKSAKNAAALRLAEKARGDALLASLRRLPVRILYASTTGTARRYAEILCKELFALNVSNFHLDVRVSDLADFNPELLPDAGRVVLLLPTWSGGVPGGGPAGAAFVEHLRDMATDFRVQKGDYLSRVSFAVFGLGNSEYDENWCRAAVDADALFRTLGATPLLDGPPAKGDEARDMEGFFRDWLRSRLVPVLCEAYARECGADASAEDDAAAAGGCGPSGCGSGGGGGSKRKAVTSLRQRKSWEELDKASAGTGGGCGPSCACESEGGADDGGGDCCGGGGSSSSSSSSQQPRRPAGDDKAWLPQKEWRRQKRAAKEEAEREAERERGRRLREEALAAASAAAGIREEKKGEGDEAEADDDDDAAPLEEDEEDAVNDRIIAESDAMLAALEAQQADDGHRVAEYVGSDDEDGDGDEDGGGGEAAGKGSSGRGAASTLGLGEDSLGGAPAGGLVDLEDLGRFMKDAAEEKKQEVQDHAAATAAARAGAGAGAGAGVTAREMVTPTQRRTLTREGYKIIGSHSAVKLCRWTKAQLRGRGGCYKHTCYGIESHRCMEATPSLACANKCTFCWRHNRHPVGKEWRWAMDAPDRIVEEAVREHVKMINSFKGAPGVRPDRLREAFQVRHCALSLVGEPIMYPEINRLLRLLHARRISTFLVTNAQFPEAIASLEPVTQLYVSIDAATKETLRAIDRPLFADFWERFLSSLDALRRKGQRTVYRLTLIKGQNMAGEDVDPYLELIRRGDPEFIEVKGVTYCGTGDGVGSITMANVPWHAEVRAYCELLAAKTGGAYGLAAAHEHSCCVLLAKQKFRVGGTWYTHIDFDKFQDLVARYYASEGRETFSSMDYLLPTPDWAVWDAPQAGFDPEEMRWRRTKDGGVAAVGYKPSESGCG